MKKLLMAAVAVSAIAATPAFAAGGTSASYDVNASVTASCTISTGSTLTFTAALTDASVATTGTTTNEVDDTNAYCNQTGTHMSISHTHLTVGGGAPAVVNGFTNEVDYTPVVTVNGSPLNDGLTQLVNTFAG